MDSNSGISDDDSQVATSVDPCGVAEKDGANNLSVAGDPLLSDPAMTVADGGADGAQSPPSDPGFGESKPQTVADTEAESSRTDRAADVLSGIGTVLGETQVKRVSTDGMMRDVGIGKEQFICVAKEVEFCRSSEDNLADPDIQNAPGKNETPNGGDTENTGSDDDAVAAPPKAVVDHLDTDTSVVDRNGALQEEVVLPPEAKSPIGVKGRSVNIKSPARTSRGLNSTTPRAKTTITKKSPGSTGLSERLYAKGMEVKKRRDEMSKIEPEVGPFAPQLATKGWFGPDVPEANQQVFSRLYEESRLKQMRDEERREAAAAAVEAELYVSPSNIKKISARRATDMYERSMKMKAESERKREEIASSVKHTFSPDIQKRGKSRGRASSVTRRSAAPERLYSSDHLRRRDERLEAAKSVKELEGCTFSPRLMTRKKNSSATDTAVYNRLYDKATSKKEVIYVEEGTFAPDITSSQRKVKASRSRLAVHERLHPRALSVSPDKALNNRRSIEASPRRAKSVSRIRQLYGKGVLKAQTELIAAQKKEKRLEAKSTGDEETIEFQTAISGVDVSLLDMESPKGKEDQPCSDENVDPTSNMKSSSEVFTYDTPKKHEYNTINTSAKGEVNLPQAYESGKNVGNGVKETISGSRNTPGSVIGLGPRSTESIGSIEFASI
eukprot:CAMPEP_0113555842 /NCGR_PEP_ID=MMETSP0015_2-20120614/16936_1 /TAXON_ID=2838 /ORGANISM="Odontella" /LENGTH=669 /DNA_ID=CAMNT_0000457153 /DNA_START=89 /DNA_END=2098 /DNA_ORIENTATION=- /assembly_acc=CAM_ASM_000160